MSVHVAFPLAEPLPDCDLCPRLATFRRENEKAYPNYFNGPAPTFGDPQARLLIVGLAPGLHGANQTGRPFTGDYAGDLLYETLAKFNFSNNKYAAHADDGLALTDTAITNAVRCVPPKNKPETAEIRQCAQFLDAQIAATPNLKAVLCLGKIAHDATVSAFGEKRSARPFSHGGVHKLDHKGIWLFDSYHCSRYNTNTRRLTPEMFEGVFDAIRTYLNQTQKSPARSQEKKRSSAGKSS
ncbi:MAG: uracil-DNA glycosylase [Pseudomonadota bacterium]